MSELEFVPSPESAEVAEKALAEVRSRSFSGRHPELGKMINCPVCSRRHRSFIVCEQKFTTGRYDLRDPKPLLIAGVTPETETVVESRKVRAVFGARLFAKKRLHPHPNKRALRFIEIVRWLTPDEYTQEDLAQAKKRAARILAKEFGRRGFLPPIWQRRAKEENAG